jgi:hypothetical protein
VTIIEKGLNIAQTVAHGASRDYPYNHLIRQRPESYRISNPTPENTLDDLLGVINKDGASLKPFKSQLGIDKTEILKFYVAFADQHYLPFSENLTRLLNQTGKLVSTIEDDSRNKVRPITITEQLNIALKFFKGDLSKALINLAVGTRAVARGCDTRLVPQIPTPPSRILNWQKVAAPFGFSPHDEDPAGDTYHFWEAMVLAISACERDGFYNHFTGSIAELMGRITPEATEILRYKICKKEGKTHPEADILGFEIGKALALILPTSQ